ncbi:nucleoside 2-deoxyribosyltransferase [Neisseria perflava]|uniref:nucleoside 2-deoxyribosyltransferase n=1 Tax=Neisseria perflava TaxID=33053 RepID=UPI0020A15BB3|nr:nucleoside 2-deoxyribosyltransferase [Neisseria perflava]MCP1773384.1 nucleoside 2-deoxyribosyltransferase [Neisseria perflava]
MRTLSIYCAGGDVFLPEAERNTVFQAMKDLAENASRNLQAKKTTVRLLIPTDNEIALVPQTDDTGKRANALTIRLANEAMIRQCDAVFANLSPFRSAEPDCGTAYECGFARELGKPVLTYTDNPAEQTAKYQAEDFRRPAPDGRFRYTEVEDFALPFNLMLYDDTYPIFNSFAEYLNTYLQAV